jgi:hypothetical protein
MHAADRLVKDEVKKLYVLLRLLLAHQLIILCGSQLEDEEFLKYVQSFKSSRPSSNLTTPRVGSKIHVHPCICVLFPRECANQEDWFSVYVALECEPDVGDDSKDSQIAEERRGFAVGEWFALGSLQQR